MAHKYYGELKVYGDTEEDRQRVLQYLLNDGRADKENIDRLAEPHSAPVVSARWDAINLIKNPAPNFFTFPPQNPRPMPAEHDIEHVLNRMYNWKMSSAHLAASNIADFPADALAILKEMGEDYGNCGWNEGKVFDRLRENNLKVANMLGYDWDEDADEWVKRTTRTLQETFDLIVDHLARQKRRGYDTVKKCCTYRTPDGSRCVVGCLLSQESIDQLEREGRLFDRVHTIALIDRVAQDLKISDLADPLPFYVNMQNVHDDGSNSLASLKGSLKEVAQRYGLNSERVDTITSWQI